MNTLRAEDAERLVVAASAAPSLLNTQPWRFRVHDDAVEIHADPTRALPAHDPQGRGLAISCGAASFNVRVAAAHLGRDAVTRFLPDPGRPTLMAVVVLGAPRPPDAQEEILYQAVPRRTTNRFPFSDERLPRATVAELVEAARVEGATLRVLDHDRSRLAMQITAEADRDSVRDPARRAEIARWTSRRPEQRDGIPEHTVGPAVAGHTLPLRDFGLGHDIDDRPEVPFEAAPQLAVLGTAGDDRVDWLVAGQALQRVLLLATARAVSASLLSQPIEFPGPRQRLETICGCRPQMLLRLGYGTPVPAAPRRPISEMMADAAAS